MRRNELSLAAQELLARLLVARDAIHVSAVDQRAVDELDALGLIAIFRGEYIVARGVKPG